MPALFLTRARERLDEAIRSLEARRYRRIMLSLRLPVAYALAIFATSGVLVPLFLAEGGVIAGATPISRFTGWAGGTVIVAATLAGMVSAYLRAQFLWDHERRLNSLQSWLLTGQNPGSVILGSVVMAAGFGLLMAGAPALVGLALCAIEGVAWWRWVGMLVLIPAFTLAAAALGAVAFFVGHNLTRPATLVPGGVYLGLVTFALWVWVMQRERGWSGPWEDHPGRIVLVLSLLTPIPSLFGLASRDWWNSTILARFGEPGFVWVAAPATWATLIVAAGFCCWASLRGYMRLRDDPDRLGGRKRFETEEFGEEFYWKGFGNPVWTRDVRTRLRHKETTEFIFFASVAVAAGACIPLAMTARDLSDPLKTADAARNVFFWLSMTLVALVTLIGPGLTADAITEERAQGSLELLIATPLTPREILVGKLLGAAGVQLLLVSPSLPLFGLCFLFHGAQGDQVLAVYALVVTSIVVCSFIGLAQSAVCTRSGVAKFFAYLITTFFVALPGGPFWVAAAIAAPGAEMRASLMSGAAVSVVVGVVWLFVLGLLWGNASEALEYHEY